jgi:brefeldin A-inhibited guanine nucleotide-exchange protein
VIWAILHNNLFDLRVPAFTSLFKCLVKIRFTARTQNAKNLCKVLMHALFKSLTDRLRLQFMYFKQSNPTRYFYPKAMKEIIKSQAESVLQGLVDKTVLMVESSPASDAQESTNMKYFTDLSKNAMADLPAQENRPDFTQFQNNSKIVNEKGEQAGAFGWCAVTRKPANFYCKEKRVPISSIECKLKLAEEEEQYLKLLKLSRIPEQVEIVFHKNYPLIFEELSSKCFEGNSEKERLLFLNLLYSVIREPFTALKSDPRFIMFVKKNVFPNLMRIALNNEEEILVVCLRIFVSLVENFRRFLRKEIGVFIEEVCLKMLDSPNSKFVYKYYLLQVLTYLIEKNFLAFELFLNFDCREDSNNLCQRIIDLLVKTCQGRYLRNIYKDMVSPVEEAVLKKEASKSIVKLIRNCSMLLNKAKDKVLSDAPEELTEVLTKKKKVDEAITKFNAGKRKALGMLRELGIIDDTAESLAMFLKHDDRVAQTQIGEIFGGEDEFSLKVLDCFLDSLDFKGMDILDALKYFLSLFELPKEGQKIERVLDAFSKNVAEANPEKYTPDASFQLSFLLMMIHTDTYNPKVVDKMNLTTFLSIGKNIVNHEKPVPQDVLSKYFYSIKAEPLAVHESEKRQKEIQDTLNRTFREKEELFKNESLKFIENFWEKVKMREIIEDYRLVKSYSVLKVFLYNIWTSLQAFFSTSIASTEDIETLRDLVDTTMSMIKLCDVFEMQTERDSFLTILVQFSNLEKTYGRAFTEKNLLFIQSVLDIASKEGNHLRTGWKLVLNCVVSLNAHHQKAESLQNVSSNNNQLTIQDQNALFIKKKFSRDSLKKLFADTTKLSEDSLLFFMEGLARLAVKELEKVEEARFAYTIEEIMNVFHYNQYRNPLAWIRIWKVINQLFDDIVSQTSDKNISMVLLSSNCLKNLVSLSFSNEKLIKNNYQSNILELYVTILSNHNLRPDYLNFSLLTLMDLLRKNGSILCGGAKELIAVLNLAEELVFRHMNIPNQQRDQEGLDNSLNSNEKENPKKSDKKEKKTTENDLKLKNKSIEKKFINISGTVYLEVLQDILQILKFIFENLDVLASYLKDHLSGLLNVIINLSRKTNLNIVFSALEYHEKLFNLFWNNNQANKEIKEQEQPKEDINNQSTEESEDSDKNQQSDNKNPLSTMIQELKQSPKHLFFSSENFYYQQFIHPALKSLIIYSKWNSQEDFKNAVNRLFEFLHKIEKYLLIDSWTLLFEEIFHPLLFQTVHHLNPQNRNKHFEDFREIILFTLKNMFSFSLYNENLPLELIEMNFKVVLNISHFYKQNKFFWELLIFSLNQNITETGKMVENIWIDDIWSVIIKFLRSLFHDNIPSQLIKNPLFDFVVEFNQKLVKKKSPKFETPVKKESETTPSEQVEGFEVVPKENSNPKSKNSSIDLENSEVPSLDIDCKYAETQCRFVLNLMKLIEKIFKTTKLMESSSQSLIELAQESKELASAFNDNVLYRFIFWKKGYMYNRECLPSLHSFERSVLRARFLYLKQLYGTDNAEMVGFIINTYKDFGLLCKKLEKAVLDYKTKPTLLFKKKEEDREFELHRLTDTQTRTFLMFDFVNDTLGNFIVKNELEYFAHDSQNQELINQLVDFLAIGPSMFYSNLLKCVDCLGCNKCYAKTAKQRKFVDITSALKKLIQKGINYDFKIVKDQVESLTSTPLPE